MKFSGSFPALITPYDENGLVNWLELKKLAQIHQIYSNGLVLLGSTGESWLIKEHERQNIVKTVREYFSKPIIIGVPCFRPEEVHQASLAYQEFSPAAYLLAAPPYLKLSSAQACSFFSVAADSVSVPIIVYHIPGRNNVCFSDEVYKTCHEHPMIVGIKETVLENLEKYSQLYPNLTWFAGEDGFLASSLISASINIGGNLFPQIFSQRPEYFDWHSWQNLINKAPNPLVIKKLMQFEKLIESAEGRFPLGEAGDFFIKDYQLFLKRCGIKSELLVS